MRSAPCAGSPRRPTNPRVTKRSVMVPPRAVGSAAMEPRRPLTRPPRSAQQTVGERRCQSPRHTTVIDRSWPRHARAGPSSTRADARRPMARRTRMHRIGASSVWRGPSPPSPRPLGRDRRQPPVHATVGHVYVNNNSSGQNTIAAFDRHADGSLTPIAGSPFNAGGAGTGAPYGSAGGLQRSADGRYLLATDPASNQISVLRIKRGGRLAGRGRGFAWIEPGQHRRPRQPRLRG